MGDTGLQPQQDHQRDKGRKRFMQVLHRFRIGLADTLANGLMPHGPGHLAQYIDTVLDGWTSAQDRDIVKQCGSWGLDKMADEVKKAVRKARVSEALTPDNDPRVQRLVQMRNDERFWDEHWRSFQSMLPKDEDEEDPKMVDKRKIGETEDGLDEADDDEDEEETDECSVKEAEETEDEDEEPLEGDDDETVEESSEMMSVPAKGEGKIQYKKAPGGDGPKGRRHNVGGLTPPKIDSGTPVEGGNSAKCGGNASSKGGNGDMKTVAGTSQGVGMSKNSEAGYKRKPEGKPLPKLKERAELVRQIMKRTGSPEAAAEFVFENATPKKAKMLAESVRGSKRPAELDFADLIEGELEASDQQIERLKQLFGKK